jgi:ABC-type transport system involved in multi-copper enzyme maturation permease subunit
MTATTTPARRRPRVVSIFLYTLQSCLPPKRWFALMLPCVGALMFGLIARVIDQSREQAFGEVATEGLFSLIVPIAALIIGDAVLGAEIRAGTFHFTWLSPAPTWQIVLGRWGAGSFVALITIAPACALAAVVAGTPQTADAAFVAAAFGSVAYIAIFLLIGCITRRTAIWALAFVFLVERLLGEALTGIAQLSPTWLSRSIFVAYLDDRLDSLIREGIPYGSAAITRLVVVTAVVLLLANWRMRHMRLSGASD